MANEDVIYDALVKQGFTPAGAAGVVGNLQGESGSNIDPNASGDGGTSHGIAQWHLDRWTALVNAAKRVGKSPNDLGFQVSYLVQDLNNYGILSQIKSAKTPGDAVNVLVSQYERPADIPGQITSRTNLANAVLQKDGPSFWDLLKGGNLTPPNPLDPLGVSGIETGAIQSAIGDAFSAAASALVGAVQPIAIKLSFVTLGVVLIAGGAYVAVKPKRGNNATS